MRHRKRKLKLGVKSDHRLAMMRNMTASLVEHGRIKVTHGRAKRLRAFIEPIITRLKEPTMANVRIVSSRLNDRATTLKIAADIAPLFKTRPGGYTRIMKLSGYRMGDAADMALIEFVEESLVPAYSGMVAAPKAKKAKATKAAPKKAAKAAKSDETKAVKKKATSKKAD